MSADAAIARARLAKAQKLADVLVAHGSTMGAEVDALPEGSRRTVEQLAGVGVSSDVTWAMVGDLVASRGALTTRLAELPEDPFDAF